MQLCSYLIIFCHCLSLGLEWELTFFQATSDPHLPWRLLDTHEQVWVSLLWGHCSFFLGPGAHMVLFVPWKSLFPQSCGSSCGSMVGLMVTSSKKAYAIPRYAVPRAPKSLLVWLGPTCLFFLLFLLTWETDLRKYCCDLCQIMFCLCSLLEVLGAMDYI